MASVCNASLNALIQSHEHGKEGVKKAEETDGDKLFEGLLASMLDRNAKGEREGRFPELSQLWSGKNKSKPMAFEPEKEDGESLSVLQKRALLQLLSTQKETQKIDAISIKSQKRPRNFLHNALTDSLFPVGGIDSKAKVQNLRFRILEAVYALKDRFENLQASAAPKEKGTVESLIALADRYGLNLQTLVYESAKKESTDIEIWAEKRSKALLEKIETLIKRAKSESKEIKDQSVDSAQSDAKKAEISLSIAAVKILKSVGEAKKPKGKSTPPSAGISVPKKEDGAVVRIGLESLLKEIPQKKEKGDTARTENPKSLRRSLLKAWPSEKLSTGSTVKEQEWEKDGIAEKAEFFDAMDLDVVHRENREVKTAEELSQKITDAKATVRHFARSLHEQIQNYKPPLSRMRLTLDPKELGSVEVTLISRGHNLHVQVSSNPAAIGLMATQGQELKQQLVNMGFTDVQMQFNMNQQKQQQGRQTFKRAYGEPLDEPSERFATMEIVIPRYV